MSRKTSQIWKYFVVAEDDPTKVLCQVPGCPKDCVSWGKTGSRTSHLTNTTMSGHLKKHHLDLYQQFKGEQEELNATVNEKKRKLGEDNEMEAEDPHTLRNQKDQQKFLMPRSTSTLTSTQPSISSYFGGTLPKPAVYATNDPRAKAAHLMVLKMIIRDLLPFSTVNRTGFFELTKFLNQHFELGSDRFYQDKLDKVLRLLRISWLSNRYVV